MVRAKKKQKRLDAIVDNPSFPPSPSSSSLRRSSRERRAPVVLDSSPVPSHRKKRPRIDDSSPTTLNSSGSSTRRSKEVKIQKAISFDSNNHDGDRWISRQRENPKGKTNLRGRKKKKKSKFRFNRKNADNGSIEISPVADRVGISSLGGEEGPSKNDEPLAELSVIQEELNEDNLNEESLEVNGMNQSENLNSKDQISNPVDETDPVVAQQTEATVSAEKSDEKVMCENENVLKVDRDAMRKSEIKEGRRCGLCGGGTDGRPPKVLVRDLNATHESDKEAYEELSGSEEPNYDVWDGFGEEPGWLGRLLGPIRDQYGISRIWVHQNCAVWSPEVYFAGPGYLKSVRAALYRGRALKCSRCGRPGATVGCRVDRCPKTYHLPCSRADGSIFDHKKFLIACNDHRHLFQPQGNKLTLLLRKLKLKKLQVDLKRRSDEARRKDLEAEDKWLENCGEDEEFLKRESKRLHRDLLRIAPTYIGGSCESPQFSEGWESVAGLQDVIRCMKEVVILPLLYPEVFDSLSLTPPRGVLLHGHPGTGKTLVVRALIGACSRGDRKIAYFARKGADCLGKYVGDAERQLRLLFQVAEKSQPSIIFFDEIDGLAPCRSRRQDQTHNSVVATLLSLMDGLKSRGSVVVIGATNRPDAVDPALRRPGRFDREIYFPLPTCEDRAAILSLHTKSWPGRVSGSLLSSVANQTVGYAGADLRSVCTQAAINALKRQCPLSEILSLAEKGFFNGTSGPPPLPHISVDESDWLLALASAPPPCSRREAGAAASDVVALPLESHLVPCFLKPLCWLLVSLSLDERLWLPSSLMKTLTIVKGVIFSDMERNKVPIPLWPTHIYSFIEKEDVANELVKVLTNYGIITGQMGLYLGTPCNDVNSNKFGLSRSERSVNDLKSDFMHSKLKGFRVLIGGHHQSGQQRLASCFLHAFLGQIDIHKVNLATMSQEGNGDIISGLTQILMRCLNFGRCIIYMPRIDLWAVDKPQKNGSSNGKSNSEAGELARVSGIWSTFTEQIDSACTSMSTIILATSEIQLDDLPIEIMQFFNTSTSGQPNAHTIPRFSVNLNSAFNPNEVINSCAFRLSHELILRYIQLVHQSTHDAELKSPLQFPLSNKTEMETKTGEFSSAAAAEIPSSIPTKTAKSNILVGAIWSFGYQILRYPQFSELCWVTSKLREGPSAGTKGPWKGWPFNTCVVRTDSTTSTTKESKKDQGGTVRGLVAVGLRAYRGEYSSVYEVCSDVRKVLELLVQKIRARVLEKRDPYRYFHILTQVAFLDDMVLNWAYSFQRSYGDKQIRSSSTKPSDGNPCNDTCDISRSNPSPVQQDSSEKVETEAQHEPSRADAVTISNDVIADQSALPGTADDRMELEPPIGVLVSGPNEELAMDPPIEAPMLDPSVDEMVWSETKELQTLTEAILKESQNLSHENGISDLTTLPKTQEITTATETISKDSPIPACESRGTEPTSSENQDPPTSTETIFASRKKDSCTYICCHKCFHEVHAAVHKAVSKFWRAHANCSTVEDMHDIFTSYSLNLISAISKNHETPSERQHEEAHSSSCPCHEKSSGTAELAPRDCECHLCNGEGDEDITLRFLFKDGVLIPTHLCSTADGTEALHCSWKRLCVCPVLDLVNFR
ncbi:TAT-binding-like protein [Rhynchospora pubera]|uniref:TAT-binding-like protein n=1 Tax=Rhynchospora pubera TaxID=906938 RepID=A0AAV8HY11_9POAL|nr:TAT-binding-like protein [Rhynchospora pubera]